MCGVKCKVNLTFNLLFVKFNTCMVKEEVKNRVHEYRIRSGFTQEELGNLVGVTRQTIIAIEKGNYTPSVLLALKISKALRVEVEKLFIYEK